MVVLDQTTIYDVVLILEDTANLGGYYESLKKNYIQPALE